ncbi:MAG TPA: phosphatidylserine/phosphatidylglycerophosphate/cardiolipin synthase family protein [Polyangiaceae bacterium]|nr:phosphatidylserine/phosphatidylglycerophosphate/cardiolipin synthase family protein [Polyangiaceae bacterium]
MSQNFAEMLVDGHRILPSLLADIEAARASVHISVFLFFRDPIGEEIADALVRKAAQGVTVRVLLNVAKTAMGDPFSTGEKEMMKNDPSVEYDPTDVKPLCKRLAAAGVLVHDTNIDYDADPPGISPRLRSIAARVRSAIAIDDVHIDHRKIIIIDGRIGYCGGANLGAQYLHHDAFDPSKDARVEAAERKARSQREPWWKWHDSLTRFEGPIVQRLEAAFHERWSLDGGEPYESESVAGATRAAESPRGFRLYAAEVHCNEPNPRPNDVRELYLRLIAGARRSIFIENPYPYHPAIIDSLCRVKAARPEVRITLIAPARVHNDNSFSQDAQEHEYERLIAQGVEVHEYQHHFTHLKTAVFDERFSIHGSTNLNYRSLEDDKDFELVVLVDSSELGRWMLENVRDADLRCSRRITREELREGVAGIRKRMRHPWTLALCSQRML